MSQVRVRRPNHVYFWEDGELWCRASLRFTESQWEFMQQVMQTMRMQAQDFGMSDSKCVEMAFADYAASYGVEADREEDFVQVVSDDD